MIKLEILYGELFNSSWQTKSFKDEAAAIEWCRRNANRIICINNYRTCLKPISHYQVMDAIRGVAY